MSNLLSEKVEIAGLHICKPGFPGGFQASLGRFLVKQPFFLC